MCTGHTGQVSMLESPQIFGSLPLEPNNVSRSRLKCSLGLITRSSAGKRNKISMMTMTTAKQAVDNLYEMGLTEGKKPRAYREEAHRKYNSFSKSREKTMKTIRTTIRQQLDT